MPILGGNFSKNWSRGGGYNSGWKSDGFHRKVKRAWDMNWTDELNSTIKPNSTTCKIKAKRKNDADEKRLR